MDETAARGAFAIGGLGCVGSRADPGGSRNKRGDTADLGGGPRETRPTPLDLGIAESQKGRFASRSPIARPLGAAPGLPFDVPADAVPGPPEPPREQGVGARQDGDDASLEKGSSLEGQRRY